MHPFRALTMKVRETIPSRPKVAVSKKIETKINNAYSKIIGHYILRDYPGRLSLAFGGVHHSAH